MWMWVLKNNVCHCCIVCIATCSCCSTAVKYSALCACVSCCCLLSTLLCWRVILTHWELLYVFHHSRHAHCNIGVTNVDRCDMHCDIACRIAVCSSDTREATAWWWVKSSVSGRLRRWHRTSIIIKQHVDCARSFEEPGYKFPLLATWSWDLTLNKRLMIGTAMTTAVAKVVWWSLSLSAVEPWLKLLTLCCVCYTLIATEIGTEDWIAQQFAWIELPFACAYCKIKWNRTLSIYGKNDGIQSCPLSSDLGHLDINFSQNEVR